MPSYDLDKAERDIRDSLAQVNVARSNAVREGLLDLALANALVAFDEARVQFILAGMRLENDGMDRPNILAAAGYSLGSAWANGLNFALGQRERAILNGFVHNALADNMSAEAAAKTIAVAIPPEPEPIDIETATPEGSA